MGIKVCSDSLDAEALAGNLSSSITRKFSCTASSQHLSVAEIRIPYATCLFSLSSFQPFWRHHISQSTPRLAGSSSDKQQCQEAPIFLLYLFQRPFSNLQPTQFRGQGYLEVEVDMVELLPQDLVSAGFLRERSHSKDAELRAVD